MANASLAVSGYAKRLRRTSVCLSICLSICLTVFLVLYLLVYLSVSIHTFLSVGPKAETRSCWCCRQLCRVILGGGHEVNGSGRLTTVMLRFFLKREVVV